MILGNDVSNWQGDINFDVYKNNANFIIFKTSEGTGFTDPKFSRNQQESRRVGLARGFYHFARPDAGNSPGAEADYFLKVCGPLQNGEVLVLDYEPPAWGGDAVNWCKQWLDHVFQITKCRPLIYLNQSQTSLPWKPVIDAGYGLWLASYTYDPNNNSGNTGAWPFMAMQQWTNQQTVPGISGQVDGDVFFGDIATFQKYGFQDVVVPIPAPDCPEKEKYQQFVNAGFPDPQAVTDKIAEMLAANNLLTTKVNNLTHDNLVLTQQLKDCQDTVPSQASEYLYRLRLINAITLNWWNYLRGRTEIRNKSAV